MRRLVARSGRERGAVSVELVGLVLMLVLMAWVCVQGVYVTQIGGALEKAARDGARAGSLGAPVSAAVQAEVPGWARLDAVRTGSAAVPGCAGSCVRVTASVPVGLPGVTFTRISVSRDAELPRS